MNPAPFDPYAAIRASIARVAPDADLTNLASDAWLTDELELDSMDVLNIVTDIFETTGVNIPERDYGQLSTLDDFAAYLGRAASQAR